MGHSQQDPLGVLRKQGSLSITQEESKSPTQNTAEAAGAIVQVLLLICAGQSLPVTAWLKIQALPSGSAEREGGTTLSAI